METPECDQFTDHRRAICRGERQDMPLHGPNGINAYRTILWGFHPLETKPNAPAVSAPPEIPSIIIRGWNFATAITKWTLAGMPRRTQAEIDARLAICQACPFLQNDHCTQCGCACVEENRLINKLALATETCPHGKW